MRRTVVDARQALEDALPSMSDYHANRLRQWLKAEEDKAKEQANTFVQTREGEVLAMRDGALRELTEVRDAYNELANEGTTGRISANDYALRLNDLPVRQARADQQLATASQIADRMEQIEEAPVEWFSEQQRRMPHLMTEAPL